MELSKKFEEMLMSDKKKESDERLRHKLYWTKEMENRLIELVNQGYSDKQVAEALAKEFPSSGKRFNREMVQKKRQRLGIIKKKEG